MSTAIAMAPAPATAPHDRSSHKTADLPSAPSQASSPPGQRISSVLPPLAATSNPRAPRPSSASPKNSLTAPTKSSPPTVSRNVAAPPQIFVKKEPGSPDARSNSRPRPRNLDLSKNTLPNSGNPVTGRPMTARDSALGIQEVGIACLSPGFVTKDPIMQEQLQRSMSVREHQRQIIEQRLQQQSAKCEGSDHRDGAGGQFTAKTPGLAQKRRAPPGLSIVAPSHEQFANERVIQSAPLGQSFTGRHNPQPLTRHIANQPSTLSNSSHIHHVPARQTQNRLPPIADVLPHANLTAHPESSGQALYPQQARGPLASPSQPPPMQAPTPGRSRDFKSAEEAQVELAGGRPELLPKLVHYGGHQPPTPPSPQPLVSTQRPHADASRSASNSHLHVGGLSAYSGAGKRRSRAEYEEGMSPPLGTGRGARRGAYGDSRESPETQRAKREEFLRLCECAWDLFHS